MQNSSSLTPSRFGFFSPASYFEAKILVSTGKVAIGVAAGRATERIGWMQRQDSIAIGDTVSRMQQRLIPDGLMGASTADTSFSGLTPLSQGDVVGCGLRWADPQRTAVDIFLTRNGKRVATAKRGAHPGGLPEIFARASREMPRCCFFHFSRQQNLPHKSVRSCCMYCLIAACGHAPVPVTKSALTRPLPQCVPIC